MPDPSRRRYVMAPSRDPAPEIAVWLWALDDVRKGTLAAVDGWTLAQLDAVPEGGVNSAGTLLYHLAATEMAWLYEDVLERPFPMSVTAQLAYPYRDDSGHLWPVRGEDLDAHARRLAACRSILVSAFEKLSRSDFQRVRRLEDYDVTPEWVIYHLLEHEAHHRAEIRALASRR